MVCGSGILKLRSKPKRYMASVTYCNSLHNILHLNIFKQQKVCTDTQTPRTRAAWQDSTLSHAQTPRQRKKSFPLGTSQPCDFFSAHQEAFLSYITICLFISNIPIFSCTGKLLHVLELRTACFVTHNLWNWQTFGFVITFPACSFLPEALDQCDLPASVSTTRGFRGSCPSFEPQPHRDVPSKSSSFRGVSCSKGMHFFQENMLGKWVG